VGNQSKILAFTDITQEMRDLTDNIVEDQLMILPKTVWGHIKGKMGQFYPGVWSGLQKK
jgi:hypothetical protein